VGLVVCVATGLLVGVINALLINVAKLVPFIATLVTLGAGAGLALVLTGGGPIGGGPAAASSLPVPVVGPFSIPTLIVIVIAVISGLFLHLARFGRYTYAIGGNEFSAIASGISVRRHITKVYMLSGALAGLAGMITYANLSGGSPSAGAGGELNAIAAVVIGGASLTGGVGRMTGTVIGSLILVTVTSGLIVANIDPNWNQVVVAILIAAAVAIQTIRRGVHSHGRKS
jgi:ribose transport system permease protein